MAMRVPGGVVGKLFEIPGMGDFLPAAKFEAARLRTIGRLFPLGGCGEQRNATG